MCYIYRGILPALLIHSRTLRRECVHSQNSLPGLYQILLLPLMNQNRQDKNELHHFHKRTFQKNHLHHVQLHQVPPVRKSQLPKNPRKEAHKLFHCNHDKYPFQLHLQFLLLYITLYILNYYHLINIFPYVATSIPYNSYCTS